MLSKKIKDEFFFLINLISSRLPTNSTQQDSQT